MRTKRTGKGVVVAVALLSVLLLSQGCKDSNTAQAQTDSVALCTACGQIEGSDVCCAPDAAACAGCDLAKGSPGCCKIEKGAESAAICTKCGQIKGADVCCKPDQATCDKCNLVKGSPGCCKLPPKQA